MTATYLTFAVTVFFLIASPGPIVTLVIADARHSWPGATIFGGVLSAQLLLLGTLLLIYTALDINPTLLDAGQVVGGLYLSWLGFSSLRSGTSELQTQIQGQRYFFWRALKVGLSNPKDILFFLAFLPSFIDSSGEFSTQALMLTMIWALIDITILLAYSALSRQLLSRGPLQNIMNYAPGIFLLGLGLLSTLSGLKKFAVPL